MSTRLTITNTYADRTNWTVETVESPKSLGELDLDEWWGDVVMPLTGDGKGGSEYGVSHAFVTKSDLPGLVGKHYQWAG